MADETGPVQEIVVDGEVLDMEDLSFREQREMRRVLREDLGGGDTDPDELSLAEVLPAAIFVFKRRSNPEYTLDEALDLKMKDVLQERTNGARPTKPRAKTRAKPAAKS